MTSPWVTRSEAMPYCTRRALRPSDLGRVASQIGLALLEVFLSDHSGMREFSGALDGGARDGLVGLCLVQIGLRLPDVARADVGEGLTLRHDLSEGHAHALHPSRIGRVDPGGMVLVPAQPSGHVEGMLELGTDGLDP